jgi:hypothetical protein
LLSSKPGEKYQFDITEEELVTEKRPATKRSARETEEEEVPAKKRLRKPKATSKASLPPKPKATLKVAAPSKLKSTQKAAAPTTKQIPG